MSGPAESQMICDSYLTLKSIKERLDRHSYEWHESIRAINKKLDDLKESQHEDKEELLKQIQEVEVSGLKDSRSTNTKVATLAGIVSTIVSIIVSTIRRGA